GNAIDQDIICQLLYPHWAGVKGHQSQGGSGQELELLGLETLDLPIPGEPDLPTRYRLQQRLESSAIGQSLLDAAKHLKVILQEQDRFTLELGDHQWVISRRELEGKVFIPFIQRLNRELNTLLAYTGVSAQGINQVVCTGGTATLGAIARWLRQKLPNATIVQDTYTSNTPNASGCSRVAYGLATLPLYPQVLDLPRQQYGDYFLLLELLRTFPEQPLSVGAIMQSLERRGINTYACQLNILALLEGQLPVGLVPADSDLGLLSSEFRQHPDYQLLTAEPLFYKEGNQMYRPNVEQCNRLRRYLGRVMASTQQQLEEPFVVSLTD
ncbi:MAG: hypothetical protein VKJ46_13625, partial [Leptolyngbyaceae bacterium]|nr:hypothetical protein [Leptolyngbyaceae bacterium]